MGEKNVLKLQDVKFINMPKYDELSCHAVSNMVRDDKKSAGVYER